MKHSLWSILAVAVLFLYANTPMPSQEVSRHSGSDNGAWLYHSCLALVRMMDSPSGGSDPDKGLGNHCADYITGFMDASSFTHSICTGNATNGTIVRIYVAYMQDHPKLMDQMKAEGYWLAMKDAYSCPNSAPPK